MSTTPHDRLSDVLARIGAECPDSQVASARAYADRLLTCPLRTPLTALARRDVVADLVKMHVYGLAGRPVDPSWSGRLDAVDLDAVSTPVPAEPVRSIPQLATATA